MPIKRSKHSEQKLTSMKARRSLIFFSNGGHCSYQAKAGDLCPIALRHALRIKDNGSRTPGKPFLDMMRLPTNITTTFIWTCCKDNPLILSQWSLECAPSRRDQGQHLQKGGVIDKNSHQKPNLMTNEQEKVSNPN